MIGFFFGLLLGASVSGNTVQGGASLGTIPMRCLYAFEVSEAEYRVCRKPSLLSELYQMGQGGCSEYSLNRNEDSPCYVPRHMDWEVAALRKLSEEVKKQASSKGGASQ